MEGVAEKKIEGIDGVHRNVKAGFDPGDGIQGGQNQHENQPHEEQIPEGGPVGASGDEPEGRHGQIKADEHVQIPQMGPAAVGIHLQQQAPEVRQRGVLARQPQIHGPEEKGKDDQGQSRPENIPAKQLPKAELSGRIQQQGAGDHDKAGHGPHHGVADAVGDNLLGRLRGTVGNIDIVCVKNHDSQAADHPDQAEIRKFPGFFCFCHDNFPSAVITEGEPRPRHSPYSDPQIPGNCRSR